MKVTILTNMPTPYRVKLWTELDKFISLDVVCITTIEKNRSWAVECLGMVSYLKSFHFVFPKKDWSLHFTIPFTFFYVLIKSKPDVIVITGYDSLIYWEALMYAKILNIKLIFWNGSTLLSSRSRSKTVNRIKRLFISSFDGYYTYGTLATQYLESFDINKKLIITGRNTVDSEFYKKNTSNNNSTDGIVRLLYVGQLIDRKGVANLINALSKTKTKIRWLLTIVGDGPDLQYLSKLVASHNLIERINFVGFKQKNDILYYYSESDVFVMPSLFEVWGLVLNEALASGLFCVASKYAGATQDLIQKDKNGVIFDPKNEKDFIDAIDKGLTNTIAKKEIKEIFKVNCKNEALLIYKLINRVLNK